MADCIVVLNLRQNVVAPAHADCASDSTLYQIRQYLDLDDETSRWAKSCSICQQPLRKRSSG